LTNDELVQQWHREGILTPPISEYKSGVRKRLQHHSCTVALHAMYYNFVRIHQTLKVTPAMAAGVTDRLWEMKDVAEMLEAFETSRKQAA
jgi:hypothetical protein